GETAIRCLPAFVKFCSSGSETVNRATTGGGDGREFLRKIVVVAKVSAIAATIGNIHFHRDSRLEGPAAKTRSPRGSGIIVSSSRRTSAMACQRFLRSLARQRRRSSLNLGLRLAGNSLRSTFPFMTEASTSETSSP